MLVLLALTTTSAFADVSNALNVANAKTRIGDLSSIRRVDHMMNTMSLKIFQKAEGILRGSPAVRNIWEGVVKPRLENFADHMSESSRVKSFLKTDPISRLQAYQKLLEDENLLQVEEDESTRQHLLTLTDLMLTYIVMMFVTIFLMATTKVFRKPTRGTGDDKITVCKKGLPHFVCTKARLLLFLIVFPIMLATTYTTTTRSMKYLSEAWGFLFFVWGLGSLLFLFSLLFGGTLDKLVSMTRCALKKNLVSWRSERQKKRDNVIEESELDGHNDDFVQAFPAAMREMQAFFQSKH